MEQKEKIYRKECPSCTNTEFVSYLTTKDFFLTQETFDLVRCINCQLVFTNPIPNSKDLPGYYNSPNYLSHTAAKTSFTGLVYNSLRNINLKGKFNLISKYKSSGKVLDIGQGTGEFLNYMSNKGWEVTGVEPNPSARQFAIENYNLPVIDEPEITGLNEASFDVISMWHVLEHVTNLSGRLHQVKRLIKKDGILLIAVPNLDSPDSVKYKEKWAALDVPRHLYHFTDKSMTNLLREFDFELVTLYPLKLDAYYVSLLSEKYLKNSFPYPSAFISGLKSNIAARKENNYSSMVFVAKPI